MRRLIGVSDSTCIAIIVILNAFDNSNIKNSSLLCG